MTNPARNYTITKGALAKGHKDGAVFTVEKALEIMEEGKLENVKAFAPLIDPKEPQDVDLLIACIEVHWPVEGVQRALGLKANAALTQAAARGDDERAAKLHRVLVGGDFATWWEAKQIELAGSGPTEKPAPVVEPEVKPLTDDETLQMRLVLAIHKEPQFAKTIKNKAKNVLAAILAIPASERTKDGVPFNWQRNAVAAALGLEQPEQYPDLVAEVVVETEQTPGPTVSASTVKQGPDPKGKNKKAEKKVIPEPKKKEPPPEHAEPELRGTVKEQLVKIVAITDVERLTALLAANPGKSAKGAIEKRIAKLNAPPVVDSRPEALKRTAALIVTDVKKSDNVEELSAWKEAEAAHGEPRKSVLTAISERLEWLALTPEQQAEATASKRKARSGNLTPRSKRTPPHTITKITTESGTEVELHDYYVGTEILKCPNCGFEGPADEHFGPRTHAATATRPAIRERQSNCRKCRNEAAKKKRMEEQAKRAPKEPKAPKAPPTPKAKPTPADVGSKGKPEAAKTAPKVKPEPKVKPDPKTKVEVAKPTPALTPAAAKAASADVASKVRGKKK